MSKKQPKKPARPALTTSSKWRSRIVGHGPADPKTLTAHPKNYRIHPGPQREAMAAVLAEVGWVEEIIVNKTTGRILNGHMRVELAVLSNERKVPVTYVELNEAEENLILASLDPLAGLAMTDEALLAALLGQVSTGNRALGLMFDQMQDQAEMLTPRQVEDAAGSTAGEKRNLNLGDRQAMIKPVLYAPEVAVFEQAIRMTGEKNRGKALLAVCQSYVQNHGTTEERQLDVLAQGALA